MQNHSIENVNATANGMPNGAIFTQMQMNFDYNHNANPNGLELAGFCSPSGILHHLDSTTFLKYSSF